VAHKSELIPAQIPMGGLIEGKGHPKGRLMQYMGAIRNGPPRAALGILIEPLSALCRLDMGPHGIWSVPSWMMRPIEQPEICGEDLETADAGAPSRLCYRRGAVACSACGYHIRRRRSLGRACRCSIWSDDDAPAQPQTYQMVIPHIDRWVEAQWDAERP